MVKIELKRLEDVARYYEFPLAVFFDSKKLKGTRKDNKVKKIIALEKKIKELIKEELE